MKDNKSFESDFDKISASPGTYNPDILVTNMDK